MSDLFQDLKNELCYQKKNGAVLWSDEKIQKAFAFNEGYKTFLDHSKTEREAVDTMVFMAKEKGFSEFDAEKTYAPGDKVYLNNRGKSLILAVMGSEPIEKGVKIVASHIDSPRLDLKQVPLYENSELALFKTHYYGGIKKYQWTAIPLSLHGVVIKKDLTKITVCIGEEENDPVFCVTDLLPHLAQEQMKRPAAELIKGEELNVLIGSLSFRNDKESEQVKLSILSLLKRKYNICEEDFLSAELEVVPAFKAKDIGFDRSLVGSYGQDDRVCAYTSLMAALELKTPSRTVVTVFADKEEVGSAGATGLRCVFLKDFIEDLAAMQGKSVRKVLANSKCLSADVGAAHDPTFPDVDEDLNAAKINYGALISKFTGSRGKSGSNDASAEYMGEVRKLFADYDVLWQTAELGRVDLGGGGTVASLVADLNVDTVDIGVPVLSMHSPYEITSKIDVYSLYCAFAAFNQ